MAKHKKFKRSFLGYPRPTTNTISAGFKRSAEKSAPQQRCVEYPQNIKKQ